MGRYPKAFKQRAVARLNQCENIVALSQELGVSRRLLYTRRDQLDPVERSEGPPANARESTLRREVSQLTRLLADKTLKMDFFKRALQNVEARRQRNDMSGMQSGTLSHHVRASAINVLATSGSVGFEKRYPCP